MGETARGPPQKSAAGLVQRGAGNGLLSRGLATGVPSALSGLTTVFGMGTGVAPTLESPAKSEKQKRIGEIVSGIVCSY